MSELLEGATLRATLASGPLPLRKAIDHGIQIFDQYGPGSGPNYTTYLRKTDRASAIRLGEGSAQSISPDGKWVLVAFFTYTGRLTLLPTGAGESKVLRLGAVRIDRSVSARWLPDGRHVVFAGVETGHQVRSYVMDVDGGAPRAVTPEDVVGTLVSPNGRYLAARGPERKPYLVTLADGTLQPLAGVLADETFTNWDASGRALFVHRASEVPVTIFRVELATGRRQPWKQIAPADTAGISSLGDVLISSDGGSYAYGVVRGLSDLYVADGLR